MGLKLMFVNASLTDGGSERAMSLVAQALARRGHDVTMILVREKERTYPVDERVQVIQLRYPTGNKARLALSRVKQIRKAVKTGDYDFVVSFMTDLNITTLLATLGLSSRIVISERAFPGAAIRSNYSRLLQRVFYRFADTIVYQTRDAQESCPKHLRRASVVIPNMIEQPAIGIYTGIREKRIVSMGRLTEQKNFSLLLRAFAEFNALNPDWRLEIYGRGELENQLRRTACELGIGHAVIFQGYIADVTSKVQSAGMFVLASDYEGISNAMAEAMALGLPTVCTDCPVGGAALLIEHRVSGMLVPVRDQESLFNAINEVASDESLAAQLTLGAQESVARFLPDKLVTQWEEHVFSTESSN